MPILQPDITMSGDKVTGITSGRIAWSAPTSVDLYRTFCSSEQQVDHSFSPSQLLGALMLAAAGFSVKGSGDNILSTLGLQKKHENIVTVGLNAIGFKQPKPTAHGYAGVLSTLPLVKTGSPSPMEIPEASSVSMNARINIIHLLTLGYSTEDAGKLNNVRNTGNVLDTIARANLIYDKDTLGLVSLMHGQVPALTIDATGKLVEATPLGAS